MDTLTTEDVACLLDLARKRLDADLALARGDTMRFQIKELVWTKAIKIDNRIARSIKVDSTPLALVIPLLQKEDREAELQSEIARLKLVNSRLETEILINIQDIDADWLSFIDMQTIEQSAGEEMLKAFSSNGGIGAASVLLSNIQIGDLSKNPASFWHRLEHEFRILLCTEDKKYAELRKQIQEAIRHAKKPATVAILSAIAGVMGPQFGVLWVSLLGIVGIAIKTVLVPGKEAFCVTAT